MEAQLQDLSEELTSLFGDASPELVEILVQKIARGVAFWEDLELKEAFHLLGINQQILDSYIDSSSYDKTLVVQRLIDDLNRVSLEDGLTKVYSRRYFERAIVTELDRSRRERSACGLILADLDHFKNINDEYGHDAGDVVLKSVANCIQSSLRSTDSLSRIGGEEFAILVPGTNNLDAGYLANRVCKDVENLELMVKGESIRVTLSQGIAINNPGNPSTPDELYELADQALYQAKKHGRNCTRFAENAEASESALSQEEKDALFK